MILLFRNRSLCSSLLEIGWAAGFIEGDGSFARNKFSGSVCVSQVNLEPLEHLLEIFGGSVYRKRFKRTNPAWNDAHEWRATGPRSRGIMMTLYSMLSAMRQEQVRCALQITGGHYVTSFK